MKNMQGSKRKYVRFKYVGTRIRRASNFNLLILSIAMLASSLFLNCRSNSEFLRLSDQASKEIAVVFDLSELGNRESYGVRLSSDTVYESSAGDKFRGWEDKRIVRFEYMVVPRDAMTKSPQTSINKLQTCVRSPKVLFFDSKAEFMKAATTSPMRYILIQLIHEPIGRESEADLVVKGWLNVFDPRDKSEGTFFPSMSEGNYAFYFSSSIGHRAMPASTAPTKDIDTLLTKMAGQVFIFLNRQHQEVTGKPIFDWQACAM